MRSTVEFGGRTWRADLAHGMDISIPLEFDSDSQPSFFGAPRATATPLQIGGFTGAVRTGASCNCATYSLTPHCNGTHTESFGHLTAGLHSVHELAREALVPTAVLSAPVMRADAIREEHDAVTVDSDRLITARALDRAAKVMSEGIRALVVRTLPNARGKSREQQAPYFTTAAMRWIVARGIEHLVVDVPSLDRGDDGGRLLCHRVFWDVPARETNDERSGRPHATVTEFAFVPDDIADGLYVLNLQVAPFVADAAPSRPLLYPVAPL